MRRTRAATWRIGALAGASLLLAGCTTWTTWIGYRPPLGPASFQPAATAAPCPRIGTQNLSADQARAITEATGAVCDIFASEAFAAAVLAKTDWLASCDRPGGMEDAIPAAEVLRIVRLPKADVSVFARKPLFAIGQIDPANARIAVPKRWLDWWHDGTTEQRAEIIRTMGHELTHFSREGTTTNIRFRDGGHGSARCPDQRLASYAVGELVAKLWREGVGA